MHAPAITRQRRPFLAPVWATLLGAALLGGFGLAAYRSATTTTVMLLVRVAAKEAPIDDPPLSPEAEERAQRLARVLGTRASLDALYVSDERGAQQTAAPLAQRLHRASLTFPRGTAGEAALRMLHEHRNGTIAAVSGSAAAAQILGALCGAELAASAAQTEGDVVYVISVPSMGQAHLTQLGL